MDAILLVAHGSENGNGCLTDLASEVERLTGVRTSLCFKRFGSPRPAEALERLASGGASEVVAVPLFLTEGRYVASIPRNLRVRGDGTALVDGREVTVRITGHVGAESTLASCAVGEVLRVSGTSEGTGVVIVGHGGGEDAVRDALESAGFLVRAVRGMSEFDHASEDLRRSGATTVVRMPFRMTSSSPEPAALSTPPVGGWSGMPELVAGIAMRADGRP